MCSRSGVLILVLAAAVQWTVSAQAPSPAAAPLTLEVTCDPTGQPPSMRVQLVNKSDRAVSVIVGFNADGKTQIVNSLDVIAIRPATGAEEVYAYVNPKYATAKGTPWVVSLAPGATHTLEVLLRDFISTMTYTGLDPVVATGTRLIFEARSAGKGSTAVWTGKLETRIASCGQ
jgi:hypothetical protein